MNPGYAGKKKLNESRIVLLLLTSVGRAELPHNIKTLFRPIVMQAADVDHIAETMLLAAGFSNGTKLASQLLTFFKLFEALVSKQVS